MKRTRRAFEKQLVIQGMSRDDARRLSTFYEELKEGVLSIPKQALAGRLTQTGESTEYNENG